MARNESSCAKSDDGQEVMLTAYRHDAHKFTGDAHDSAPESFAGVPVNRTVPYGADADAAALSRPDGRPEQTVDTHATHYRLSLLTGEHRADTAELPHPDQSPAIRDLLTKDDPAALHHAWLTSDVARGFNESVYYPYTSLKYHTLLVAALLDNYRAGHEFVDLDLVVDPADELVPHRTVYTGDRFGLRIDATGTSRPSVQLGSVPWRSWAAVWSQLLAHPLEPDNDRFDRLLDSNLRRIGAWSTALQYIEDFEEAFDR